MTPQGDYGPTPGSLLDSLQNDCDTQLSSCRGIPSNQCEMNNPGGLSFQRHALCFSIFRLVRRVPALEPLHAEWRY